MSDMYEKIAKQKATLAENNRVRKATLDYVGDLLWSEMEGTSLPRDAGRHCKNVSPGFEASLDRVKELIRLAKIMSEVVRT
jgi:hypothetical protein